MNKKTFYITFTTFIFFLFLNMLSSYSFAWGDPQIVNKINSVKA